MLTGFTGVDDPYEPPAQPDVVCHTGGNEMPQASATAVLDALIACGFVNA